MRPLVFQVGLRRSTVSGFLSRIALLCGLVSKATKGMARTELKIANLGERKSVHSQVLRSDVGKGVTAMREASEALRPAIDLILPVFRASCTWPSRDILQIEAKERLSQAGSAVSIEVEAEHVHAAWLLFALPQVTLGRVCR
ncbi:hypothetical protein PLICRDRAFT_58496 [Plicaturopsis crispa FD-325 SS-3]|uniref:Uncharacterized protein n=1 Tax=Plicaturopsis crispa FD-325 SS-3 TaxID=944288 RepID=A0A0C9T5C4_PLICR|nr:hypothetical protein PLICRDRAFT_58496 [Plicaturopsis crispa FD-325 SS-3]